MIQVQRIGAHDLPLPASQTEGSAGYDLQLSWSTAYVLGPGDRVMMPTGFAWEIPRGYVGMIRPRSGLAVREGLDVLAGVVDSDFRAEVQVVLINHGHDTVRFSPGDRIAQMVVTAINTDELVEVESLDATERGNGGFGSTGIGAA